MWRFVILVLRETQAGFQTARNNTLVDVHGWMFVAVGSVKYAKLKSSL
jgi:hypothetical protein